MGYSSTYPYEMTNIFRTFFHNGTMTLPLYDDHKLPKESPTILQIALFELWLVACLLYIYRYLVKPNYRSSTTSNGSAHNSDASRPKSSSSNLSTIIEVPDNNNKQLSPREPVAPAPATEVKQFSKVPPPPTFDEFLKYVGIMGAIMMYFYLADYKKVMPMGERVYNGDIFLFLVFIFFLVGCSFTLKTTPDKILNRDQTEEWKGWMQVMFVWYHYFAAKDWYNWIRVYIAAYVWMTGFGNFSFFWVRADFSIWRVMKMLFRLNFLVLCICAVVSNEYMLYYICAMHTHWFLSVYAMMAIYPSLNKNRFWMCVKFAIYFLCNFLIFDVGNVALYVFRPLWLILGFNDGKTDIMHEWAFRAGLDHWVAFIGMVCAYNYPHFEAFILKLEKDGGRRGDLVKVIMALVAGAVYATWHFTVLPMEKYTYNAYHPYTSFIPILCFIVYRNLYPWLRTRYVSMFAFLGKITLETYLSQLHVYLQSNAKHLIVYIPDSPLLNFSLSTILYLIISYVLFNLTTEFSAYLLPNNMRTIGKNLVYGAALLGASMAVACIVQLIV